MTDALGLALTGEATSWDALQRRCEEDLAALGSCRPGDLDADTARSTDLGQASEAGQGCFGRHADPRWRRLVAAMLTADWAAYPAAVDRVSFERLALAAGVFPAGFRVWWARHCRGAWLPVGYTGWHPISERAFIEMEHRASSLRDRSVLPLERPEPGGGFVYVFNFSIVEALRRTAASRRMLEALARDLDEARPRGLASIAVSEEGARVLRRFGLEPRGALRIGDAEETVFTGRSPARERGGDYPVPLTDPGLSVLDQLDNNVWITDVDRFRMVWGNVAMIERWKVGDREGLCRRDWPASEQLRAFQRRMRDRVEVEGTVRFEMTLYPDDLPPQRMAMRQSAYVLPDGQVGLLTEATPVRVTDPETQRRMDAVRYAPLVITTHGLDGTTLSANEFARAAFGDSFDLVGLFKDAAAGRALLERLSRGEEVIEDAELRAPGGSGWYAVQARTVTDPVSGLPAVLLSAHEVTSRRALERAKDELLSVVSHELRTPMTSIRGAVEMLASGMFADDPATEAEMLQIARENVQRLNRTVDDLLDVRRLEAGAVELVKVRGDLGEVVRWAVELSRPGAQVAGVSIRVAAEEGLLCELDEQRIGQVVGNLVSNAVKHSSAGQVVRVEVGRAGGRARVVVADEGPGVPPGFRDRIFAPFSQADASDTRRTGGTGLGLYIAKTLVEGHGGTLGYEAEAKVGARFYFELPLLD